MRKGIDISKWNKEIDYSKLKEQGIEFAIIRCGYGKQSNQKDELFEQHYANLKANGIKVGCYLYSYCNAEENAKLEAENCLNFIKGKEFDLPVFYDLEDKVTKHLGKEKITNIALKFCEIIRNAGYKAGVYANLDWFKNYIDVKKLDNCYIWLAQWADTHSADFRVDFWQYTDSGKILGITGNVDLNYQYTEIKEENYNKFTDVEMADKVIKGEFGNGEERKNKLESLGYNYTAIQKIVNQKLKEQQTVNSVSKIYYTVKKGDNLSKISKLYGTTVSSIVKLNNIKDPNKIYVNQVLRIK